MFEASAYFTDDSQSSELCRSSEENNDFQLNQWYVTKCFPYFYMPKKAFWMRFAVKFTQKDASTKKGNPYANHTVEIRHYNNYNEIVYQENGQNNLAETNCNRLATSSITNENFEKKSYPEAWPTEGYASGGWYEDKVHKLENATDFKSATESSPWVGEVRSNQLVYSAKTPKETIRLYSYWGSVVFSWYNSITNPEADRLYIAFFHSGETVSRVSPPQLLFPIESIDKIDANPAASSASSSSPRSPRATTSAAGAASVTAGASARSPRATTSTASAASSASTARSAASTATSSASTGGGSGSPTRRGSPIARVPSEIIVRGTTEAITLPDSPAQSTAAQWVDQAASHRDLYSYYERVFQASPLYRRYIRFVSETVLRGGKLRILMVPSLQFGAHWNMGNRAVELGRSELTNPANALSTVVFETCNAVHQAGFQEINSQALAGGFWQGSTPRGLNDAAFKYAIANEFMEKESQKIHSLIIKDALRGGLTGFTQAQLLIWGDTYSRDSGKMKSFAEYQSAGHNQDHIKYYMDFYRSAIHPDIVARRARDVGIRVKKRAKGQGGARQFVLPDASQLETIKKSKMKKRKKKKKKGEGSKEKKGSSSSGSRSSSGDER